MNCSAQASSGSVARLRLARHQRAAMRRIERLLRHVAGDRLVLLEAGAGDADVRRADGEQPGAPVVGLDAPGDDDVGAEHVGDARPVLRRGEPPHGDRAADHAVGAAVEVGGRGGRVGVAVAVAVARRVSLGEPRSRGVRVGRRATCGRRGVTRCRSAASGSGAPARRACQRQRRGPAVRRADAVDLQTCGISVSSRDERGDGLEAVADRQRRAAPARGIVVAVGLATERGVETRARVAERQRAGGAGLAAEDVVQLRRPAESRRSRPCAVPSGRSSSAQPRVAETSGRRRRSGC